MRDYSDLASDGACQVEECEFMYGLIRAIKPKYCVETGTHKGLSASYIGQALKDNGFGHLDTCDPIDTYGAGETLEHLAEFVTYNVIRGDEFEPKQDIDFLFIDGLHETVEVMKEFNHYKDRLTEDAMVLFHDCGQDNEFCGVNGAIEKLGLETVRIPSLNVMRLYAKNNRYNT